MRCEDVRVVYGVPQASVLRHLLFLLYSSDLSTILNNILVSYADDSKLLAEVPNLGRKVPAVLSLKRDFFVLLIGASAEECC